MKLDAKTARTLELPAGKDDVIHFDSLLPGFGLRLRRGSGDKVLRSYVAQYRRAGGTRRLLIGNADVLSAEQARQAAKSALAKVQLGGDPARERKQQRDKDKRALRAAIDEYLEAKRPPESERERKDTDRVRARTYGELVRYLRGAHFKALHSMPVDAVAKADVASCLRTIIREHGSTTAARARSALSACYVWLMQNGMAESNPIVGTPQPKEAPPRERVLTPEELLAVWKACQDDGYGKIVRLLILLGARRQEIGSMTFDEISEDGSTWTLSASRSKNGRAHTLPLLPMAREIIDSVPKMVGHRTLFGTRGTGFSGWSEGKRMLDRRCGVKDFTLHDLRRSAATGMADIGIQPWIIEEILNHRSGRSGPAGVYNKSSYEREVRAALAQWEDRVRTLTEGGERKVLAFSPAAS